MPSETEPIESEQTGNLASGFIDYVNSLDTSSISEMLASRAIPSLLHSMRRHGLSELSSLAVSLWTVDMLLEGLKTTTVKRYSGALRSLYNEWRAGLGLKGDEPAVFSVSLQGVVADSSAERLREVEGNLEATERFVRMSVKQDSPAFVYNKAFQYLLYDPFASLKDIAAMKFSDQRPDSLHLEDIVISMRNAPQAKYVFPLQQGKRREGAIVKDLLSELHATGRRAGMKFADSFSRDSITAIWIAAALREDISYSEIRGMIQNLPAVYSCLSLIPATQVSEKRTIEIMNTVAYSISNKNPGWFVLRLRSGVTPEAIKERLKEKESPLQRQIQYYYPLRSIKKIENKKVVSVEVPVIPGLLFFRLPYDRVAPLIGVIGDLAWCYRSSANPSSPYSVIPQAEMRIFQRCVGSFTEDVEMDIVSALPPLNVGDSVMIEDGSHLDGQMAIIRKVRNVDGTLTYTLRLSDTEFIKFKDVSLPASHISKVGD